METLPLVVIAGPTASGKTALAVRLAQEYGGEIICADSRTIYKSMDIGTAKPTPDEQALVPHWGLDLVLPGEYFSAADFKRYAEQKINEIRARGNIPFLVGGTGLYVDAVVFDYKFGNKADPEMRSKLESHTVDELQKYCNKNNIKLPENSTNKRYLIRAIEQKSINTKRRKLPLENCFIVGITTDKGILRKRIHTRIEQLFQNGVVEESISLGKLYGWDNEAMTGNVYQYSKQIYKGSINIEEAKEKLETLDWRLAKRQLTWLRRNEHVKWLKLNDAEHYLATILAPHKKA